MDSYVYDLERENDRTRRVLSRNEDRLKEGYNLISQGRIEEGKNIIEEVVGKLQETRGSIEYLMEKYGED